MTQTFKVWSWPPVPRDTRVGRASWRGAIMSAEDETAVEVDYDEEEEAPAGGEVGGFLHIT